jgi:hypothetical protein
LLEQDFAVAAAVGTKLIFGLTREADHVEQEDVQTFSWTMAMVSSQSFALRTGRRLRRRLLSFLSSSGMQCDEVCALQALGIHGEDRVADVVVMHVAEQRGHDP